MLLREAVTDLQREADTTWVSLAHKLKRTEVPSKAASLLLRELAYEAGRIRAYADVLTLIDKD